MGTVDMSNFSNPPVHLSEDERVLKSLKSIVESSQEGSERKRYLQELYSIGREMMEESGTVMIPALSFILDLDIFKTYPDIIDDIENAYKPSTGILSYRPIIAVGMAALDAYSLENESNLEKEKFLKSLKQKRCEFAASCTENLPQDWDKDALENKILSIAIKYQSEGKRCIFITDNNAQSIKATSLGIPALNVERLQARLNAIFYYWNERNRILSDEDATEIDWGTLRPDYDYGELDESEYLNFGNIDKQDDRIPAKPANDSILIDDGQSYEQCENAPDNTSDLRVSKELFETLKVEKNEELYFAYSITSKYKIEQSNEAYEKVCRIYDFLIDKGIIDDDTSETFNAFLFRMTGRRIKERTVENYVIPLNCKSDFLYYLARRLNPPKQEGGAQVPNNTYQNAYRFFDWNNKPPKFDSNEARTSANAKVSRERYSRLDDIIGMDWK